MLICLFPKNVTCKSSFNSSDNGRLYDDPFFIFGNLQTYCLKQAEDASAVYLIWSHPDQQ